MKDKLELDPTILQKNLEITKLTQQIDNLTSDNVDRLEIIKHQNMYLYQLLTEVHERMYKMMEYCERLQPSKLEFSVDYDNNQELGTVDLTEDHEMYHDTKLFRLLDPELDKHLTLDDQTSRSILKDLRKVINSLENEIEIEELTNQIKEDESNEIK
jgi:hypothetical protein